MSVTFLSVEIYAVVAFLDGEKADKWVLIKASKMMYKILIDAFFDENILNPDKSGTEGVFFLQIYHFYVETEMLFNIYYMRFIC